MELIKEAVSKARASLEHEGKRARVPSSPATQEPSAHRLPPTPTNTALWMPLRVTPDAAHLERHRIVSFAAKDPSHVAFNLLRTKVYKMLKDGGWKSLAITSPKAGCGKTMVAINLAFSLARQANHKTVLVDLDLKKSAMARTIGVRSSGSVGQYLEGAASFEDCFVQISENLVVGVNNTPVKNSAEVMHAQRVRDMLRQVSKQLSPDVVIFDLPPMLASDDAIAFLPNVESALLVAAAGKTTAADIDECETQASAATNFLGVVLNKVEDGSEDYYDYAG